MSKLISRAQAAEYLGVSASTLARWAMLREGPDFLKLGGKVRYSVEKLDTFIERSTVIAVANRKDR